MELTECPHNGVYLLNHRGWLTDVRIHHQTLVCASCGKFIVTLNVGTHESVFEFSVNSQEAADAIMKSCRQSAQEGKAMLPGMPTPTGWICPKCGKVYAPFVVQCMSCGYEKPAPKTEYQIERKQLLTEEA